MARLTGCLPLLSFLVFFVWCVEGSHWQSCHRVFPLHLTAAAMPCQYLCAHYDGYRLKYMVRGEDDGTPCQRHGKAGVCWNGVCLTRYGVDEDWSQHVDATSKVPLRIRKRDVSSTKGATVTKTTQSNGDTSVTTKTMRVVQTVKSSAGSEGVKTAAAEGLKGTYITGFNGKTTTTGTTNSESRGPNVDVDPFAFKGASSGSQSAGAFYSSRTGSPHVSQGVQNANVKITFHRGPNGERIRTRTVRKFIIRKGPTTTVKRIIIKQGSAGGLGNLINGGSNMHTTKTVKLSFSRGSMGGRNGLLVGGQTGMSTKTSQITTVHTTRGAQRNPIAAIVQTIKQQRISGGTNVGGAPTATKTVSTVAVTKSARPSVSVVQVTKQAVTPLAATSSGTSNTATLRGVEVEVPGYTAGLRHNWKWVLARRVGVYPPYVQALDPDVLFYKLGLRKPNLPSLPGAVLNILNRVPVHPVGSDIYGFLLSSKILEKIRGFTDGVNGLTRLSSVLSANNASNLDTSNLLQGLLTGTESPPSGSSLLTKLLLTSLSRAGSNPLKSVYGSLLGGSYPGPFGSPWSPFTAGHFPASPWPFYNRGPLGRFGPTSSLLPGSAFSSLGPYDSLGSTKGSMGVQYTLSEDGDVVPSTATLSPENAESLLSDSSYIKSILSPTSTGRYTTENRYEQPYDEPLEHATEKLSHIRGVEKLRRLLKISSEQDSPVRSILKSLYRRPHDKVSTLLRRLGVRQNTHLYDTIMRRIRLRRAHGDLLSPSKHTTSYGEGWDQNEDLITRLRNLRRKSNYDTIRYLSKLAREPRRMESLESTIEGSEGSNNKLQTLVQLLLERKHHLPLAQHRDSFDSRDKKEVIDAILDYTTSHSSPARADELKKEITKALLTSRRGPISTEGSRGAHLSKIVSVQGTLHAEKRPQGLAESQVISAAYHSSKAAPTTSIPISPVMASPLEVTRQVTPMPQPGVLLGMNTYSTAASSPSTFQQYPQFASQPFYVTGGNGVSDQTTLLNRQLVSTGGVYGSPIGQPATTMTTGAGGYSGYVTVPTQAAYLSQYSAQPYYIGTSLYGSHPHYIVEGHEAPGTRWQLKVWRHRPGVSSVAHGFNGFESSHLGSVVSRARETVTRGLQYGSQPGQFGFTTFGPSVTGGSVIGATSQYVVKAPDGNIVLSRQPLPSGSLTQGAAGSNVVVSQITKQTTKTTSGSAVPALSGGLSSDLFQSAVEGSSSGGTTKSETLSELTQNKETSLFKTTASGSGSENAESLFSTGGSSSSSQKSDGDLSQSKLRR